MEPKPQFDLSQNSVSVMRNHKDTIFRLLYKDKKELLSLYNALNGTNYTDVNALHVETLEYAIYMGVKDDVAFLLDSRLNIYEHLAVNECIHKDILRDFLTSQKAKVIQMAIYEFDVETEIKKLRNSEYNYGLEEGLSVLIQTCQDLGLSKEETLARILLSNIDQKLAVKYLETYWTK